MMDVFSMSTLLDKNKILVNLMAFEISIVVRENQDCLFIWLIPKLRSLEDIGVVSFKLDRVFKLTIWQLE